MSSDSFSEISSQSWFSRIGGSIKGILFGVVLIVVSVALLSWNEGRAVKRYKTLKEGSGSVVSVESNSVDSSRTGQLVHTSGLASSDDLPADPVFGISTDGLKLIRAVEMYQWKEDKDKETQKKLGGGTETVTTYNYSKEWSAHLNDSSKFKKPSGHTNPAELRFESKTFSAQTVALGAFTLSDSQISMIGGAKPYSLSSDYELPESVGEASVGGNLIYAGKDSNSPEVGDLRISFSVVPEQEISLVAAQTGSTFIPYLTKAGGKINLLEEGMHSAASMFQTAQDSNKLLTWILRGVGFVLALFGFNLIMAPLSVLADVVPFIGNLVGAGTMLVSFLLSAVVSFLTIAIAWIVFRPILAVSLLVVVVASLYFIFIKAKTSNTTA